MGPALELFKSSPFGLSGSPPGRQSPMLGEGFTAQRFGGTIKARKCPGRSRRWSMVSHSVPEPVDLARTRRAELLAAITALESALAAPAGDPVWAARVQARNDELASAFDDHVNATEGTDGMYADILRTAPRLRFGVDRLATEHDDIRVAITALGKLIDDLTDSGPDDIGRIRDEGIGLLARLVRHRQRGADLVFEAYSQDIGGCD